MTAERLNRYRKFRVKRKYEILLVSFLVLIFGDIFFQGEFDVTPFLILQNVAASTILFYGKKGWRIPLLSLLVFLTWTSQNQTGKYSIFVLWTY